ncbi:MAG: acyl-CoA dehydrogenase family protein [Myxococcota bacterium]
MYIDFTPEQREFQQHCRKYFEQFMTDEFRAELEGSEGGGPLYWKALRQMGADGMLGVGWPREYGGQAKTPIEQYIFANEAQRSGFPFPFLTLNTVGPTLMAYGSEAQKRELLPRITSGEINIAIGYSEPNAGTDLASLTTRAVRDGDGWRIQGQKMWTSLANYCQYVWLAARTDPDAPKHRGISMFLVPLDAPGVTIQPIMTMGGVRTNATFYEDVRVPADALVGGENNGWALITGQLNYERVALSSYGPDSKLVSDVVEWARAARLADGRRVIDREWVQEKLAQARAQTEIVRLMNWRVAWSLQYSTLHPAHASAMKVYSSEMSVRLYQSLLEIFGPAGTLRRGSPGAVLEGRVERAYRTALVMTFGGGTNEVQRDIIAMAGLGLPHYKS